MDVATSGATEAPSAPIAIDNSPLTLEQAASQLYSERHPDEDKQPARAPNGTFAKAEQNNASAPAEQEAAAVEETQPSGEDEAVEVAEELPPIEPPKFWTAEQREKFAALPREAQEIIAERESARDADIARRQNETAEQRKALEAKQQQAEQERVRAEQAISNAALIIQSELARDFPDIKTHEDAAKLAQDDPFRWAQWKQRVDNLQVLTYQAQQQQQERQAAQAQAFNNWAAEQDAKFSEKFPEFKDASKAAKNQERAFKYFEKLGYSREEVSAFYNTPAGRDYRIQEALWNGIRFSEAQEKAKAAVTAPKPPVQRPGTASRASAAESTIASLRAQLDKAVTVNDQIRLSAELLRAERAAAQG